MSKRTQELKEVCNRFVQAINKRITHILLTDGYESPCWNYYYDQSLYSYTALFRDLSTNCTPKQVAMKQTRVYLLDTLDVLCKPSNEEIDLKTHIFKQYVKVDRGLGVELELDDFIALTDSFQSSSNPFFTCKTIAEIASSYYKHHNFVEFVITQNQKKKFELVF